MKKHYVPPSFQPLDCEDMLCSSVNVSQWNDLVTDEE